MVQKVVGSTPGLGPLANENSVNAAVTEYRFRIRKG